MARKKLLLIDDNAEVRNSLAMCLGAKGFTVASCASANEAVALFWPQMEEFDVVVTDFELPGLNGIEFAQHVKSLNAKIPVILISSELQYSFLDVAEIDHAIQKPFTIEVLFNSLNRVSKSDNRCVALREPTDNCAPENIEVNPLFG